METLFSILKFIGICLEVVLIFNLLIIVHELGHFLAARWRGLVIEGFGIWFGKPLWQKKINGVTYSLGSLPFGGFVKLPQLMDTNLEGQSEFAGQELPKLKPIDKIIVAFAGPLFSMLLAFVFAIIVWQVGRPMGEAERTTVIGSVAPEMPAGLAGLQPGDVILKVDGHPVTRFGGQSEDSVMWRIVRSENETISIEYQRGKEVKTAELKPHLAASSWYQRRPLRQIGVGPMSTPMVAKVEEGSAGKKAGLLPNDLIVKVNGQPIYDDDGILEAAEKSDSDTVTLDVQRGPESAPQIIKASLEIKGPAFGEIVENSPAAAAGLKAGDRIDLVDGKRVRSWVTFVTHIQANGDKTVTLTVDRPLPKSDPSLPQQFEKKVIAVKPVKPIEGGSTNIKNEIRPSIGVAPKPFDLGFQLDMFGPRKPVNQPPFEQIQQGVTQIVSTISAIASKSSIGVQHMGGPVMMMRVYYTLFESPYGWQLALWFSVIINVNLALLNMLPLPPLDGSHITLGIIEMIRGKPVRGRVLEYIVTPFTLLIIGFMLFVTFFDVQDLFGKGQPKMKFKQPVEVPAQPVAGPTAGP